MTRNQAVEMFWNAVSEAIDDSPAVAASAHHLEALGLAAVIQLKLAELTDMRLSFPDRTQSSDADFLRGMNIAPDFAPDAPAVPTGAPTPQPSAPAPAPSFVSQRTVSWSLIMRLARAIRRGFSV